MALYDGYLPLDFARQKPYDVIDPPTRTRECKSCKAEFLPRSHGQLYCDECRERRKKR